MKSNLHEDDAHGRSGKCIVSPAAGRRVRLSDFADAEGLVVAFICNHCPFAKHIREGLAAFARDYAPRNVALVAINSNDFAAYSGDAPERMQEEIDSFGYCFPYIYDESQDVAKAPDYFGR